MTRVHLLKKRQDAGSRVGLGGGPAEGALGKEVTSVSFL